jgi:hypothetical protein
MKIALSTVKEEIRQSSTDRPGNNRGMIWTNLCGKQVMCLSPLREMNSSTEATSISFPLSAKAAPEDWVLKTYNFNICILPHFLWNGIKPFLKRSLLLWTTKTGPILWFTVELISSSRCLPGGNNLHEITFCPQAAEACQGCNSTPPYKQILNKCRFWLSGFQCILQEIKTMFTYADGCKYIGKSSLTRPRLC